MTRERGWVCLPQAPQQFLDFSDGKNKNTTKWPRGKIRICSMAQKNAVSQESVYADVKMSSFVVCHTCITDGAH